MVSKIKSVLYPDALMTELRELKTEIIRLHKVIDEKDKIICELQDRVGLLEVSADATEQYSRRTNLRGPVS